MTVKVVNEAAYRRAMSAHFSPPPKSTPRPWRLVGEPLGKGTTFYAVRRCDSCNRRRACWVTLAGDATCAPCYEAEGLDGVSE